MAKNKRIRTDENELLYLYNEVNGICPICHITLIYEAIGVNEKLFEKAHIYPLNATKEEEELLAEEEKLSEKLNDIRNLICLCPNCHTKYDKPKTLENYRLLLNLKKKLLQNSDLKKLWHSQPLEEDINDVISTLKDEYSNIENSVEISYNPKTIDKKTNKSITKLTKRKIHLNVQDYYEHINSQFKLMDTIDPLTTEIISTQIKSYYLTITKRIQDSDNNQKVVFDAMVDWLNNKTNSSNRDACEIVASYFVQNCEIFK